MEMRRRRNYKISSQKLKSDRFGMEIAKGTNLTIDEKIVKIRPFRYGNLY